MSHKLRVGIIGAGIGGVALARALQKQGIDYHLFERAQAFGEVGAGVQMTPNAVKVLKVLGLEAGLQRIGFLPEAMVGRNWETANELFRTPLKENCPNVYGAEFFHVHRADLHGILSQDIPAECVTFGVQCTGVVRNEHSAVALFSDGSSFEPISSSVPTAFIRPSAVPSGVTTSRSSPATCAGVPWCRWSSTPCPSSAPTPPSGWAPRLTW